MKKNIITILLMVFLISCDKHEPLTDELEACIYKTEITSPVGFAINPIGQIDFNGTVQSFEFVTDQIGYAMLTNNVGGYVEVFKTMDGGRTWENLNMVIDQHPRGMAFKDSNIGIITVHDVSGCPPPNCLNKCVVLQTEDGGQHWTENEIEELKGILYHPKFDSDGNLYGISTLDGIGALMKSTDYGQTWEELFSSVELGFSLVTFSYELFENTFYISGKGGKLFVVSKNGDLLKTMEIGNTSIWDLEIVDQNNLIVTLSGEVIKSTNGGETWETIYNESARMIGFESADKGLMLLNKSSCSSDVYQVNDLIASTNNGGKNWIEGEETTTNLRSNFQKSQLMVNGSWYLMIENKLLEIKEE